jgi:hypothetical protein
VDLFGVTMAALAFALALNRIFDGVGRRFLRLAVGSDRP